MPPMLPALAPRSGDTNIGALHPGETRHVLVEAAWHAARTTGPLRAFHQRVAARRGGNIATVAVARRLLTLVYYGLRDGHIRCLARDAG